MSITPDFKNALYKYKWVIHNFSVPNPLIY